MKKHMKGIVIAAVAVLFIAVVSLSVLCGFLSAKLKEGRFGNMEIERKYLIDKNNLPDAVNTADTLRIVQTYINFSPEMRVREINDIYHFFTMKLPQDNIGLAREEVEVRITPEEYAELLSKQVGATIYKTRYEFKENGFTIEVDIYSGALSGLIVAEVEFASIKKSEAFKPPQWFGTEITSDSRYKNANLARYGMPET